MAEQVDGSIVIDTEIKTEGLEAGSTEMLDAIKSLSFAVKQLRKDLNASLGQQLKPEIDTDTAENQVTELREKVRELEEALAELRKADGVDLTRPQAEVGDAKVDKHNAPPNTTRKKDDSVAGTTLAKQLAQVEKSIAAQEEKLAAAKAKLKEYYAELAKIKASTDDMLKNSANEEQRKNTREIEQIEIDNLNAKYRSRLNTVNQITEELEEQRRQHAAISEQIAQQQARASAPPTAGPAEEARRVKKELPKASEQASRLRSIFSKIGSSAGSAAKNVAGKLVSGLKSAVSHMGRLFTTGKKCDSTFRSIIAAAKRIAPALLAARGAIGILRKAINAYLAANQGLATQLSNCWTSLGNILGPVINRMISLISSAVAYFTAFLKLLGVTGKAASTEIGNAGGAAADEAQELKKQLASFDDLNVLQDNDSGSGGGGGGAGGGAAPEITDVQLPDWAALLVEQLKSGKWAEAATILTEQLNSMVAEVDWAGIGDKIGYYLDGALTFLSAAILGFNWYDLGADLAIGVNHIIENVNWRNLGTLLGAKFRILIEGLGGFFATLDWASLGVALGDAFSSLWNAVKWDRVGKTLSDGLVGALTFLDTAINQVDWQGIGDDISTCLESIEWGDIWDALVDTLKDALSAIKAILSGLPSEIKTVGAAFSAWKISSKLMADLRYIFNLPPSLQIGVSLAVTGIVTEVSGIVDAVKTELGDLNFAEIIIGGGLTTGGGALIGSSLGSAILGGALGGIVAGIPAFGVGVYDEFKNGLNWLNASLTAAGSTAAGAGIGAIIGSCGGPIGTGIGALIGLAVGLVVDGVALLCDKWDAIKDHLHTFFTKTIPGLWNDFMGWLSNIPNKLAEIFLSIPDKIEKWFSDLWQPIKDFDWGGLGYNIGQWFAGAVKDAYTFVTETIPSKAGELWESIKSGFSTFFTETLPRFFTETIPSVVSDVADFFKELPTKIKERFNAAKDGFVNIGRSIIDGIKEGWESVWDAIKEFVGGFVQGFKDALGIHSPSTVFAEIGRYLIDGLFGGIRDAWGSITKFFDGALNKLKTGIGNAWENIKTGTANAWGAIKEKISGAWDGIKTNTANAYNAVKSGISTAWDSVKSWTSSKWSAVKNTVDTAWDSIKTKTATIGANVTDGVSTVWTSVKGFIASNLTKARDAASTAWTSIQATTSTTSAKIAASASAAWSGVKTSVSSNLNGANTDAGTAWKSMGATVSNTLKDIGTNVTNKFGDVYATVKDKTESVSRTPKAEFDTVKNSMTTKMGEALTLIKNQGWSGVGGSICDGIARGLDSSWTWLKNKVSNLARGLLNAAKSALGIHSPSRAFRDEVGLNIGYGVGEGVSDSEPAIMKSVSEVADAIAEEFNSGDYKARKLLPITEIDGSLTSFSDKISEGFTNLLDRLQAIADRVTFRVPTVVGRAVPYQVASIDAAHPRGAVPGGITDSGVAGLVSDIISSNMAGHEATVAVLREILEAVLGISLDDATVYAAVERQRRKMSAVRGVAL